VNQKSIVSVLCLGVMTLASHSCSSLHRAATSLVRPGEMVEHITGASPKEAPDLYKKAVSDLEVQNFSAALEGFDTFIRQNPASAWTQAATLNSGRALEGLLRWQEAANRYRLVVQSTAKAPKLQAMALYRLSFCHEALGDDTQVVVSLNDLLQRSNSLPREVATAELPARLAGAYARVGNFDRAQEFYRRAEAGISRLRQEAGGKLPEWLPRTLFLMGETSRRQLSWADFETSIRPLARGQVFLLQAAELGQSPWSDRAADDLIAVYKDLFNTIEQAPIPPGDALLAKRALQKKQWTRIGLLIDLMAELRARALPEAKASAQSQKIQTYLNQLDKRIQLFLTERPAGEGLTEEGQLRKKNQGTLKVIPDDNSLEQSFIKKSREAPSSSAQVPAPAPTPTSQDLAPEGVPAIRVTPPSPEDPNL
jgi:tetratricopeptide (TPR) repeat protein